MYVLVLLSTSEKLPLRRRYLALISKSDLPQMTPVIWGRSLLDSWERVRLLGLLSLVGYSLHELLNLFGITKEVILDKIKLVIEFKDVGYRRGEV